MDNVMVFTGELARQLLKRGYTIVDIKPDRLDTDGKRSVFIFKNENNLKDTIRELTSK